ncbi:hypothetical protein KIJ04_02905 [Leuconostoc gelidum subsp. gelidum]|uniref:hypothetical protein n=1 Tax=Leuconostoc gelidum TaxID=1244 RepID=UPI001CC4EBC4|nr:hypothetical protein [Leuconostoc gelidum]MBZ6013709.1 hypothetical protein [Leuconostoc gelidum subsp. gelidum]
MIRINRTTDGAEKIEGIGWRFARYVFYSDFNTSIVGNVSEASQTWIYNSAKAIHLSAGSSQYFNSGYDYNSMKTFYSYNPAANLY